MQYQLAILFGEVVGFAYSTVVFQIIDNLVNTLATVVAYGFNALLQVAR